MSGAGAVGWWTGTLGDYVDEGTYFDDNFCVTYLCLQHIKMNLRDIL